MFFIYLLNDWFTCYTRRMSRDLMFRGIGFFGVEPETPRPALPDAPPMHPCPDHRDEDCRPIF